MAKFRSALTKADFNIPATVVLTTGGFTKIGEYVVKSGENVFLGYGYGGQESAEGRIFMSLFDNGGTPAEIKGTVRIQAMSAQDLPLGGGVWFEARTEALNTNASNRTLQIPFNAMLQGLSKDKKYQILVKPDANATLSSANSTILMDITKDLA